MRVPPFERYVRFLSGFGLLLSGGVIGGALFMGLYQEGFTTLVLENERLRQENVQLSKDIDSLQKYKNRQSVVGKINVYVQKTGADSAPLEEFVETEVRSRVYNDLQVVTGQPLSAIANNPLMYQNLIDKKIYTGIHEKDYIVNLKTMMIQPGQLTVWITVREVKKD